MKPVPFIDSVFPQHVKALLELMPSTEWKDKFSRPGNAGTLLVPDASYDA